MHDAFLLKFRFCLEALFCVSAEEHGWENAKKVAMYLQLLNTFKTQT